VTPLSGAGRLLRFATLLLPDMLRSAALLLLTAALQSGAEPPRKGVELLEWMSGCWAASAGDALIEEAWLGPRGGLMMGVSRTVNGDHVVATERLEIADDSAGVVYRAWPSRQAPATFRAVSLSDSAVVFEDPAHDFPQRIAYRRTLGGEGLDARVEMLDGSDGFDFPYRRSECG
jgi:hypothetical protein